MDEKEINDFLDKMGNLPGMPKALNIEVYYDEKLQEITGVAFEPVVISEGAVFMYLLHNIFMAHPGIAEAYPPGALGLAINGVPPRGHSPLFDGDKVTLAVL